VTFDVFLDILEFRFAATDISRETPMPMHDWTRVSAGTYHDFHNAWITHIKEALNGGLLPSPYYALGEQRAGDWGPDVLTLKADEAEYPTEAPTSQIFTGGMVAVAEVPPQVQMSQEATDSVFFLQRQRAVTIRHTSGDRMIAIIEIVSRANRHSLQALNDFADKVIAALEQGIHVVVIDPFPNSRNDPHGIHGLIWERMSAGEYQSTEGQPLTLVSYTAGFPIKAWIEPFHVGSVLTPMPLFLTQEHYIPLPLEKTYNQSWAGVPERWKRVILGEQA
jgi:hypothetical protein